MKGRSRTISRYVLRREGGENDDDEMFDRRNYFYRQLIGKLLFLSGEGATRLHTYHGVPLT
jgi:hypothetical protein